jgi:hypothetical protein
LERTVRPRVAPLGGNSGGDQTLASPRPLLASLPCSSLPKEAAGNCAVVRKVAERISSLCSRVEDSGS